MIQNLEEIKSRLDPVDVLNFIGHEKSHPKKSGREIRDYCPIHGGDSQQSLAINEATKLFHCHSCGAKGDLISLYQQAKQIDFSEAIETLASRFQINIQREKKESFIAEKQVIPVEKVWSSAKEGNGHPYLTKKGVKPCPGLRYGNDSRGNQSITVPFYDVEGNLKTIQHIHEKGKFFLAGHSSSAAFFPIGAFKDGDIVYLAEGLATMLTIKEEIQGAAISFGSVNNMGKVVNALKAKYPNLKIIICLDDNKAALKAAQQIRHSGISFRKPLFEGFKKAEDDADFNDLKKLAGSQVLRDQLQNVFTLPVDEKAQQASSKESSFVIEPYTIEDLQIELSQTKEGLKTGYTELDEMVRIPNEAITLVAGRPSHGKTTLMLNLFLNLIRQYPEQHFYFFSFEETRQQIAVKIINILSGWIFNEAQNIIQLEGYLRCKSNNFPMVERGKKEYQDLVQSGRLRIVGESYYVHDLSSIIASLKSKVPLGAVFIDYIQKIKNKQRFGTRQLELANTSNVILETAKRCSLPIILGAQLGRDKESKSKVKLDNLREAGDLEQDANLVLGLFNPAMEKAQEEQTQLTNRTVDLQVTPLKNRNGSVNKTITLSFDRPLLKIKDKADKN